MEGGAVGANRWRGHAAALAIRCMSTTLITIGIDPGAKGAVAVVRGREVLLLQDLPAPEDSAALLEMLRPYAGAVGCIEHPVAFSMNAYTAVRLGASYGAARAVLSAVGCVSVGEPTPSAWKRRMGLAGGAAGKGKSVEMARVLFDALPKRLRHDKAEALLLAAYAGRA